MAARYSPNPNNLSLASAYSNASRPPAAHRRRSLTNSRENITANDERPQRHGSRPESTAVKSYGGTSGSYGGGPGFDSLLPLSKKNRFDSDDNEGSDLSSWGPDSSGDDSDDDYDDGRSMMSSSKPNGVTWSSDVEPLPKMSNNLPQLTTCYDWEHHLDVTQPLKNRPRRNARSLPEANELSSAVSVSLSTTTSFYGHDDLSSSKAARCKTGRRRQSSGSGSSLVSDDAAAASHPPGWNPGRRRSYGSTSIATMATERFEDIFDEDFDLNAMQNIEKGRRRTLSKSLTPLIVQVNQEVDNDKKEDQESKMATDRSQQHTPVPGIGPNKQKFLRRGSSIENWSKARFKMTVANAFIATGKTLRQNKGGGCSTKPGGAKQNTNSRTRKPEADSKEADDIVE